MTTKIDGTIGIDNYQFQLPAGVFRFGEDKLLDTVSVKDFGAVGDGVTDDTAALNRWINYISTAPNKPVSIVPAGVYKHTSPLIFSNLRNLTIKGVGGNAVSPSSMFVFYGDSTAHKSGGVRILSCYNVNIDGVCFNNYTAALDYFLYIGANASPALSTHLLRMSNCGVYMGGSGSVTLAGVMVVNTKMARILDSFIDSKSSTAIQFGLDQSEDPNTLLKGANQSCSIESSFIYGDVNLRQIFGFTLRGNAMPERAYYGSGAASVITSGQARVTGVVIEGNYFEQSWTTGSGNEDARPAISTGAYVGSSTLSAATGWVIRANTFRDRGVGIEINQGGIIVSANTFMTRNSGTGPAVQKGIVISSSVLAGLAVMIDSSNDFRLADVANFTAIEDHRTYIGDSVVSNQALSIDTALSAIGSYVTVLTAPAIRANRGGKYRISYNVSGLASSTGAGMYRANVTIGGISHGLVTRASVGASESFNLGLTRIVTLPPSTAAQTITLQVNQESGTIAANIRAGNSSNGSTFLSVEELP